MRHERAERGRGARPAAAALPLPLLKTGRALDFKHWRAWLRACGEQEVEQRRLFPWLAVSFGVGVLLFFAAEGQPALWAPITGAVLAAGAALLLRHKPIGFGVALGITTLFAGFSAGILRQRSVDAPVLTRMTIGPVTGFVEAVEERSSGGRLLLRTVQIGTLAEADRPRRVRVTARELHGVRPGDFIAASARLLPLPRRRVRATTTSRATPTSAASARSGRSPAASSCVRRRPRCRSI